MIVRLWKNQNHVNGIFQCLGQCLSLIWILQHTFGQQLQFPKQRCHRVDIPRKDEFHNGTGQTIADLFGYNGQHTKIQISQSGGPIGRLSFENIAQMRIGVKDAGFKELGKGAPNAFLDNAQFCGRIVGRNVHFGPIDPFHDNHFVGAVFLVDARNHDLDRSAGLLVVLLLLGILQI